VIIWAEGEVVGIRARWAGAVEVEARRDDGSHCRALVYTDLTSAPELGDRLLLNTAALDRGLGTGGYALVVAVLGPDGHLKGQPAAPRGHLVKSRYLPLQTMVAGADEQGSPFHKLLADADSIAGLPVVVADLHSALPAILAAVHHDRPGTRVVYLMSDHGALPLAFSRSVAQLVDTAQIAATVTVGQAFGGDLEAVTVYSGLLAAKLALDADLVVLTQGPGNLGTGTRWGFSGVACGEAVNAAAVLGGRPVGSLRISGADARRRHRGVSHHSLTAYGRVAMRAADIAVPRLSDAGELTGVAGLDQVAELADEVNEAAATLTLHRLVEVELTGLDQALLTAPVRMSTMGRGLDQDPAYFLAAAAAGRLAARLLGPPSRRDPTERTTTALKR
jgi:hypothetical protein